MLILRESSLLCKTLAHFDGHFRSEITAHSAIGNSLIIRTRNMVIPKPGRFDKKSFNACKIGFGITKPCSDHH
jgi:hypothetical protein